MLLNHTEKRAEYIKSIFQLKITTEANKQKQNKKKVQGLNPSESP